MTGVRLGPNLTGSFAVADGNVRFKKGEMIPAVAFPTRKIIGIILKTQNFIYENH